MIAWFTTLALGAPDLSAFDACADGDAAACARAVEAFEADDPRRVGVLEGACADGVIEACRTLIADPQHDYREFPAHRYVCEATGEADACWFWMSRTDRPPDHLEQACAWGFRDACAGRGGPGTATGEVVVLPGQPLAPTGDGGIVLYVSDNGPTRLARFDPREGTLEFGVTMSSWRKLWIPSTLWLHDPAGPMFWVTTALNRGHTTVQLTSEGVVVHDRETTPSLDSPVPPRFTVDLRRHVVALTDDPSREVRFSGIWPAFVPEPVPGGPVVIVLEQDVVTALDDDLEPIWKAVSPTAGTWMGPKQAVISPDGTRLVVAPRFGLLVLDMADGTVLERRWQRCERSVFFTTRGDLVCANDVLGDDNPVFLMGAGEYSAVDPDITRFVTPVDLDPPHWVDGIVRAEGRPLPGASVTFARGNFDQTTIQADARGRFRIPVSPRSRTQLTVTAEGHTTVEEALETWTTDPRGFRVPSRPPSSVEIALAPTFDLEITVRPTDAGVLPPEIRASSGCGDPENGPSVRKLAPDRYLVEGVWPSQSCIVSGWPRGARSRSWQDWSWRGRTEPGQRSLVLEATPPRERTQDRLPVVPRATLGIEGVEDRKLAGILRGPGHLSFQWPVDKRNPPTSWISRCSTAGGRCGSPTRGDWAARRCE